MGLLRLLFLGLAIYIVYQLVRRAAGPRRSHGESRPDGYGEMVRCAHCGVHLPRDRAIRSRDGHYYCTPEHRDANQQ